MNENTPVIRFIANDEHYNEVLSGVAGVRRSLWIGTADIKDLHVRVACGTTDNPDESRGLFVNSRLSAIYLRPPVVNFETNVGTAVGTLSGTYGKCRLKSWHNEWQK